ncbi:winged helix-turn-helix transcriptional regulator [Micromonospora cathayae]|uniref:Helix-turn-helix domain-containing protein n=1 Tax=Micromonospora cathayae TaxID=3028804 RepID=A0ABY7ZL43_9ACTN|nr:helix-turn-helix domain-containing protein [Micromonospora sp. HUAS 3]WDZ83597.1 helix-turn-helix domain-containing protein [Micromonospora sp. HUAS 3]
MPDVPAPPTPTPDSRTLIDAAGRLRGRWALHVVQALLAGPAGFNDLRRAVPGAGPSVLTRRLADLEAAGIVSREVIPRTPPASRYALTPSGTALGPAIERMVAWAAQWRIGDPHHDVAGALAIFQERWMLELHCALLAGPRRFGELARTIGVNEATLSQRLGDLERRGLIHRLTDQPGSPYAFTPAGRGFEPVGTALLEWAAAASTPPTP